MIISHRHKFIFLKSRKTAGTSVEIALSRLCGPDDVLTQVSADDARARVEFSGRDAQNFVVPLRYSFPALRTLRRPQRPRYFNHMPAELVSRTVPDDVWDGYFKFSIERNPYDRTISMYHWRTRSDPDRPPLDEWLRSAKNLRNWPIYAIGDQVVADFVIDYDHLSEGLSEVSNRIGVEITMPERKAKGTYREDRRPPSEVLDTATVEFIEALCADEIRHFGYQLT